MAEPGCLHDAHFQNVEISGKLGGTTNVTKYLDYLAFNKTNLTETGVDITKEETAAALLEDQKSTTPLAAITAATCIANAVNTFDGDGEADGAVYLPPAVEGTHVCLQITGVIDGGKKVFIRCAPAAASTGGADRYAGLFTISAHILNSAAAVIPTGCVSAIRTAGTVAVPTTTELIYTSVSGSTNFLGVNSEIHFYCPKNGHWIAKIFAIPDTTGATGALSVGTTALAN